MGYLQDVSCTFVHLTLPGMSAILSLVRVLGILRHFTKSSWHHLGLELFCHLEEGRLFYQLVWMVSFMPITWGTWRGRAGTHGSLLSTLHWLYSADMYVSLERTESGFISN